MPTVLDTTDGRGRGEDDEWRTEMCEGQRKVAHAVGEVDLLDVPRRHGHCRIKRFVEDVALIGDTEGAGENGRSHRRTLSDRRRVCPGSLPAPREHAADVVML